MTASCIGTLLFCNQAMAQSGGAPDADAAAASDPGVLGGDIVVTAQRRSQNAQDVGIAIVAATGEQIRALGLNASTDLAKIASNVAVSGSYGGLTSQFTIRGVTQNDFNDHVESVIATYVDDTYIAMQQGSNFTLFDIDRVEALKGPQGTLFGRNATGGLVHYITKRPTDTVEGYLDGTYASYDNVRIEGALSGPLAPGIDARLSGLYERSDGYLKNAYPEQTFVGGARYQGAPLAGGGADLGGLKSNVALRGQITADIGDKADLWVAAFYSNMIAGSAPYQLSDRTLNIQDANGNQLNTVFAKPGETCEIVKAGACAAGFFEGSATRPVPGGDFYGFTDPDGRGLTTSVDYAFDDGSRAKTWGASGKLTAKVGAANLTWVSDYKRFTKNFQFDLVPDPTNAYLWIAQSQASTVSQEVRLDGRSGGLNWVVGAYYLHINNRSTNGFGFLPGGIFGAAGFDEPRIVHLISDSYSIFGQLEYKVSDTLTAIGGLRASREQKDYDFSILAVTTGPADDPRNFDYAGGFLEGSYKAKNGETLWNWKAQLNWKPEKGLLLYAGVTQGQKAGSYNQAGAEIFANGGSAIPYKPERLVSYEIGFKSALFDRRLRVNASSYYYDYHDYQAAQWTGISSIIINADARFYGVEGEIAGAVTRDLEISLNGGYQHNTVEQVPVAGGLRDVSTTFAPEWTASGIVRYTYPAAIAGGKVAAQVAGRYQSMVWQNLNNFDANRLDGYFTADARLGWTSRDERYQLALFARNIFDKRYETVGFDESYVTGGSITSPGRPRWVGVNARVAL